ncbi:hypothetical protein SLA2020_196420 [Shorea laevis]
MKLLSWNCRGLSRPSAICSLQVLIRDANPDVLFLSETKTDPPQASVILNRLGFYLLSQVAPSGSKGGLLLAWRTGIDFDCFVLNTNYISIRCFSNPANTPWILSCVYGPSDRRDRPDFWNAFDAGGSNPEVLWLCIGDFNHILDQSEKIGGRPYASSSTCPFRSFINHFGMVDLGFTGNPFTWANNRQGHGSIKERLDRGMATSETGLYSDSREASTLT